MADATVKRTGMIGLGAMGVQMAKHMVNKGFEVCGYDISADASKRAEGYGVRTCGSVVDAGKNAEVVFVMVANDEQIHDVIERSGLLDVLARGSVICIASSCSPEACRDLAKLAAPVKRGTRTRARGVVAADVGDDLAVIHRFLAEHQRHVDDADSLPPSARKCSTSGTLAPGRSPRASTTCCSGPAWWPISSA